MFLIDLASLPLPVFLAAGAVIGVGISSHVRLRSLTEPG